MSAWLDDHINVLNWVAEDLKLSSVKATGRRGMTAESVLRCALLKQHRQLSYEELAFHLLDSASFQSFARLPVDFTPRKSALQSNISAITDATWEAINRYLLEDAKQARVETGKMMRVDSTVTDSPVHEPSDSALLWDSMWILVRLLQHAEALVGAPELVWRNHSRVAKKRARMIRYTRGKEKQLPLYKDLVRVTEDTLDYVHQARLQLTAANAFGTGFEQWLAQVKHYKPLIERVITRYLAIGTKGGQTIMAGYYLQEHCAEKMAMTEPYSEQIRSIDASAANIDIQSINNFNELPG